MKFKDLNKKQIFTWWGHDHLHTGVALGDGRAFCFDTLELVSIHANKDVKEREKFDETLQYKVGHDGRGFLCSALPGGKVLARSILLLKGEIMEKRFLKDPVSPEKPGGKPNGVDEVYITLFLLEKKIDDLGNILKLVRTAIDENLSPLLSDNGIMSTSRIKKLVLPTE